jgi:acetyl-CoA acetyltransferase
MNRRDLGPEALAVQAATAALADAELSPSDMGLVVVGNALGGRLSDQGCIRGQAWLRDLGFEGAGVINVDNSCAGGSSALHVGILAALAGSSPVLAVGVEKMWTGDRAATLNGIEDGLAAQERYELRSQFAGTTSGSVFMGQNAMWVRHQLGERGTTAEEIAATTVKARSLGANNPLAQFQSMVSAEEVLSSPSVAGALTRLMCSSFTDGAAAAVLTAGPVPNRPRVLASVVRSGNGDLEYHTRLKRVADEAWKEAGLGPSDVDLVEVHDATSAEELYAIESLGFFGPGEAGAATVAGATMPGGQAVCVNPSGGLVARGHPIGATGMCQVYELVQQLRGRAGSRQVEGARVAASVNTGGIISGDAALVAVHVLAMN